jgi:Mg2+ and Co2+ transporter CorA
MSFDEREIRRSEDGPPPFGRSWGTLYALVLLVLAALVLLFYLFTRAFS